MALIIPIIAKKFPLLISPIRGCVAETANIFPNIVAAYSSFCYPYLKGKTTS
jgi:hypothetical protein